MSGKLTYGASLAFGVLSLVLLVANVTMINSNRHLQDSANQRQADINKGTSLSSLNQGLIQALAEAAINANDTAMKELLSGQGITVTPNAIRTGAQPAAAGTPVESAPTPSAPNAAPNKAPAAKK